jgi:hypothetical protein
MTCTGRAGYDWAKADLLCGETAAKTASVNAARFIALRRIFLPFLFVAWKINADVLDVRSQRDIQDKLGQLQLTPASMTVPDTEAFIKEEATLYGRVTSTFKRSRSRRYAPRHRGCRPIIHWRVMRRQSITVEP